jgi:hypothetical protein
MLVDKSRNIVVGLTLVGAGVGEIIHAATIAVAAYALPGTRKKPASFMLA